MNPVLEKSFLQGGPVKSSMLGRLLKLDNTVCPRSCDPFYVVSFYIKWVTTFLIYSNVIKY